MKFHLLLLVVMTSLLGAVVEAQSYTYDASGRLARIAYPDGTSIDYDYDANGNRQALGANDAVSGGGGGGGCFLATAAYGSYLDPHVQSLRDFRDERLLTNAPGRAFVDLYERVSPPLASAIARDAGLRLFTRVALTPLVWAVLYPRATLLFLGIACTWYVRRRRGARRVVSLTAA